MSTTRLAVTLGDPAGIGPEIVARTLAAPPEDAPALGIAVGDPAALRRAVEVCGLGVEVRAIERFADARHDAGVIDCLDIGVLSEAPTPGLVDADAGRAAVRAIEVATRAALDGEVAGIVTAPINKEAIWAAGSEHLGHTEMLGELTGSSRPTTMFLVNGLSIFFTTRHESLRNALDNITADTVDVAIEESHKALQVLGHGSPRLAVAAINPHGGENGSFGREELDVLAPAVARAAERGLEGVVGPVPADAVFHQGLQGRYDGVLSHFHDQGHIAAKTLDFEGAITITMGLPILRTSVDHGTAFDIAGTGKASAGGLIAAFRAGVRYADRAQALRAAYGA